MLEREQFEILVLVCVSNIAWSWTRIETMATHVDPRSASRPNSHADPIRKPQSACRPDPHDDPICTRNRFARNLNKDPSAHQHIRMGTQSARVPGLPTDLHRQRMRPGQHAAPFSTPIRTVRRPDRTPTHSVRGPHVLVADTMY